MDDVEWEDELDFQSVENPVERSQSSSTTTPRMKKVKWRATIPNILHCRSWKLCFQALFFGGKYDIIKSAPWIKYLVTDKNIAIHIH